MKVCFPTLLDLKVFGNRIVFTFLKPGDPKDALLMWIVSIDTEILEVKTKKYLEYYFVLK
jgi:hypothetical protein